jgi:putative proteasome-type protease
LALRAAAKDAVFSFDATMGLNVTVGPPMDLLPYRKGAPPVSCYRRLGAGDGDLNQMHQEWEHALRRAVEQLPDIDFSDCPPPREDQE